MRFGRTNVNKFLVGEQRRNPAIGGDFAMLISDVVRTCKAISQTVSLGKLVERGNDAMTSPSPTETQMALKAMASELFVEHCEWGGHLAAMSSADMDSINSLQPDGRGGKYLLLCDPLDGSSNIDINLTVGSIFSVLRCQEDCTGMSVSDFLQAGSKQVAAGYALFGSSTMMVLTVGTGTHGFTLDREIGEFMLTHPNLKIPAETQNFSINASNERFWEPPIRRYVEECLAGQTGIRAKDFNMRWAAASVANVHHILMRGGVILYPQDTRDEQGTGQIALLHKANPLAMVIEQAGGMASTGYARISNLQPASLHQRVPVILGSHDEIERIDRYHQEYLNGDDKPFSSPLFGTRTLFRAN